MKSKLILISIVFLASLWGCSDLEDTPSSAEFNLNDRYGSFVIDTIYAVKDTFIVGNYADTDLSEKLSVGKIDGIEASFVIKVLSFPDSTLSLDSAYILLTGVGTFSRDIQNIDLKIYEVEKEWEKDVNLDETWHYYNPSTDPIVNYSVNVDDTTEHKILIDPEVVLGWRASQEINNGLYFKAAENTDGVIKEFGSFNSSTSFPKMVYVMSTDTSTVRDTIDVGLDATIFDYPGDGSGVFDLKSNEDKLFVSSGVLVHSFFKFDFAEIPKTALIDQVILEVETDDDNDLENPGHSASFYIRSVTEASQDLSTYEIDSLFTLYADLNYLHSEEDGKLVTSESSRSSFGKSLIQLIVDGSVTNEWLYLQYISELTDFSVKKFRGLESYVNHPPRIIVKYFNVER
ncbi:MAG: hypothetical protein AB7T22_04110 [Calditrichaceae bacterium]